MRLRSAPTVAVETNVTQHGGKPRIELLAKLTLILAPSRSRVTHAAPIAPTDRLEAEAAASVTVLGHVRAPEDAGREVEVGYHFGASVHRAPAPRGAALDGLLPAATVAPAWPDPMNLFLDNLHPTEPHLATTLDPGTLIASVRPHGAPARSLELSFVRLVVDADRGRASLVARATVDGIADDEGLEIQISHVMPPKPRTKAATMALQGVSGGVDLPFDEDAPAFVPPLSDPVDLLDTGTLAHGSSSPPAGPAWMYAGGPAREPSPASPRVAAPSQPPPVAVAAPAPPPPIFRTPIARQPDGAYVRVVEQWGQPQRLDFAAGDEGHKPRSEFLSHAAEQGAAAASAAAAAAERDRDAQPRPRARPERGDDQPPIDLLWLDSSAVHRLGSEPLLAGSPRASAEWLEPADAAKSSNSERDRHAVLRAIRAAPHIGPEQLALRFRETIQGASGARPLVCVDGTWHVEHALDESFALWVQVARLYVRDNGFHELASEILERAKTDQLPSDVIDNLRKQLNAALSRASPAISAQAVEATVERMLVERRSSERRSVFGGEHLRASIAPEGRRGGRVRTYLAAAARDQLPLAPEFPVTLIGELRPRQEYRDESSVALRVVAIALRIENV